jgi:hypothetical protein
VRSMKVVAEIADMIQQAREQEEEQERIAAEPPRPRVRQPEPNDGREPIKRLRPRLKDAPRPPR